MKIETRKVMKLSGIAIAATAVASATAYLTTRLLTREAFGSGRTQSVSKSGQSDFRHPIRECISGGIAYCG